jgi:hypothetical protein
MSSFVGGLFLVVGIVMIIFVRPLARAGLSFYFSDQELAPSFGPRPGRVRLAMVTACITYIAMGFVSIYTGVKLLF